MSSIRIKASDSGSFRSQWGTKANRHIPGFAIRSELTVYTPEFSGHFAGGKAPMVTVLLTAPLEQGIKSRRAFSSGRITHLRRDVMAALPHQPM
jgi:hypothetical protein